MTESKRPLKIFLCHAHADRDAVKALYTRLTNDGVDAWLDKEKLLPGQDWELEIRKAVREADVVVVCLSKLFNQAGFRQKEVCLALDTAMKQPEGEIFIIPARLEECDTLESLRRWHEVDLFDEDGYEMLMRALRARADKIGAILQVKKSWLPNVTPSRRYVAPVEKKPEQKRQAPKEEKPKLEKVERIKAKTPRKLNTAIIVALIGLLGTIGAALISSPLLANLFERTPEPTITRTLAESPTAMKTPIPISSKIKSPTPTIYLTPTIFFTFTPTASLTPTLVTVNTTSNCRKGPGREFDRIVQIQPGENVEIIGRNGQGDYLYIKVGKYKCWILAELVDFVIDPTAIPTIITPIPPQPQAQNGGGSGDVGGDERVMVSAPSEVQCPSGQECKVSVKVTWQNPIPGNTICVYVQPQVSGQPYYFQFEGISDKASIGVAPDNTEFEIVAVSTSLGCGGNTLSTLPPGNSGSATVIRKNS